MHLTKIKTDFGAPRLITIGNSFARMAPLIYCSEFTLAESSPHALWPRESGYDLLIP